MTQEALRMALEVNESMKDVLKQVNELIAENKALKEALAQPEQAPTWWLVEYHDWAREFVTERPEESIAVEKITALYTTPPQRTWVGLTDEDIWAVLQFRGYNTDAIEIAKAIEAKLKEKNGA